MAINKRNKDGNKIKDSGILHNLSYNEAAGAEKNTDVGRHLLPIQLGEGSYTTDCSTARQLPSMGRNIAVFNNDTSLHAVTLGEDSSVPAKSVGATDSDGHVGIPCAPGDWTYIACAENTWVKTDNNKLLVFLIDDDSFIRQEASR